MMYTRDLIEGLRDIISDYNDPNGETFYFDTNDAWVVDEAANRLEELQRIVDDITNDHYTDYLEFYANRCRELEEKMSEILSIISDENT